MSSLMIDLTKARKAIAKLGKQSVTVGVFTDGLARQAKGKRLLPLQTGRGSGGMVRRAVGKKSKVTIKYLAKRMDDKYDLFKGAINNASNKDMIILLKEFCVIDKTEANINRLQNLGRSIVRSQILVKSLGRNSKATIANKGFDRVGVDTGTLFKNIQARYRQEK